ncbi:hypothetical protein H632_c608p1 [Helicosporidium sp. ATCC 50920]|nr:hypothetical protein H632_c608p1 [Helicosporidium sp. ATCC 50920]|eukprot:KDD75581.1 hypothetical protein H632_c608p1 [Helicosporidium sp. ATCC 50920]
MWSAPLFIKGKAGGIGLTVGYSDVHTVGVLNSKEAVMGFTQKLYTVRSDVTATMGSALGTHLPATALNLSSNPVPRNIFTYSVAHGRCVDLSLSGDSCRIDQESNVAMYGENVSAEAVLRGEVCAPVVCQDLFDLLRELSDTHVARIRLGSQHPS